MRLSDVDCGDSKGTHDQLGKEGSMIAQSRG